MIKIPLFFLFRGQFVRGHVLKFTPFSAILVTIMRSVSKVEWTHWDPSMHCSELRKIKVQNRKWVIWSETRGCGWITTDEYLASFQVLRFLSTPILVSSYALLLSWSMIVKSLFQPIEKKLWICGRFSQLANRPIRSYFSFRILLILRKNYNWSTFRD